MSAPTSTPTTDTAKYDRQLRLWGEEGQACLESTHVCLLYSTAAGCETLKNLVLPGIGQFTIVDDKLVDDTDFNNFFVLEGSQGQSLAKVTSDSLSELNDRVKGHFVQKNPVQLIEEDLSFFSNYSLVIANNLPEVPLRKLAKFCWDKNIPLFVTKVNGFISYLRVVVPEHNIVESKPDNPADDLRLSSPFPKLLEYADGFDFGSMDSTQHSHTPYIVILLQHMKKWKAEHNNEAPKSYAEKNQFKDKVLRSVQKQGEANFDEAYKAAHKIFATYSIPSGTRAVLDDPKATNLTGESSNFWVLASAVRQFVEKEGVLPLMGSIPDMTSTTDGYIALQKLYQEKAVADLEQVTRNVEENLKSVGKESNSISAEEIKKFCKNSLFLVSMKYRSLEEEYNPLTAKSSEVSSGLAEPDSNMNWYVLLRASDLFFTKHNRLPGDNEKSTEEDQSLLEDCVKELLNSLNLTESSVDSSYVGEMVRFAGAELHPVAALLGGIVSQEVIKVVTHQFTPLNNTLVFNGMKSTSTAYNF